MINDSVREELIGKVSARLKPFTPEIKEFSDFPLEKKSAVAELPVAPIAPTAPPEAVKTVTANITVKATNQTLVEFHTKNSAVPEWRLQLQNAVRQRQGQDSHDAAPRTTEPAARHTLVTSGANALKTEIAAAPKPAPAKNADLARALERIKQSREHFLTEETPEAPPMPTNGKNYPFYIAAKTSEANIKPAEVNPPVGNFAKPKLAAPPKLEKQKLDTNKLPPLPAPIAAEFVQPTAAEQYSESIFETFSPNSAETTTMTEIGVTTATEIEEYDEMPTFAMRFNAGLFDLIIGTFATLGLLAPFMLLGGTWLSGAGLLAFVAADAVVMFVYLTLAVGFYGRTFGMRMFSLELVDIKGEEYPTFHQAAVSSSVYLLSLTFAGAGFLTIFFNADKRAAHDLASKTIIVKE